MASLRLISELVIPSRAVGGGFENIQGTLDPRLRDWRLRLARADSYKFRLCPQYRIHVQDIEQTLATIRRAPVSTVRET